MGHHGAFVTILVLCLSARALLSCEDDANFLYKNKRNKDCDWVAKKSSKRCALGTVSESCPVICDSCPCADDSEFSFPNGKDCTWVAENLKRCEKFGSARKNCPVTCGTCPTPAPTPAPTTTSASTPAPTMAPTPAPTMAPTPAPTPAPCEDDPEFKHNNDRKKDCDWVAKKSSKRCALGTASESCPVTCDSCPAACEEDPDFEFKNLPGKGCSWVAEDKSLRCGKFLAARKNCPVTCNTCPTTAPTPAPTTAAPTPAPTTSASTPAPTMAPTPAPTMAPTPASTTAAPTPAPTTSASTPAPTMAPTPAPTMAPTPASTQASTCNPTIDDPVVTTLAGDPNTSGDYYDYDDTDDGFGTAAKFDYPKGLAISGTKLYVADTFNNAIRIVDTETKEVTTFAGMKGISGTPDGTGTTARFDTPWGLAISGTSLYVADSRNFAIRHVDTGTKDVTTLAGEKGTVACISGFTGTADGTGTNARFCDPRGLAISGTKLYVADTYSYTLRVVDTETKEVTSLGGGSFGSNDGTGTTARFKYPYDLAISGTSLYVADYQNHAIRVFDTGTKDVTTFAGEKGTSGTNDGTGTSAQFFFPIGLDISCNKLYVADWANKAIRIVDTDTKEVTTVAGEKGTSGTNDGTGTNARFMSPGGLLIDPADASAVYVADADLIRLIKY